jgi:acyl carrier protein
MEPDNLIRDIYSYIKNEMNNSKNFDMETNIIEGGLIDSTGILALVIYLETKYGIEIDLEEINMENFAQVGKIAELVKKLVEV